MTPYPDQFADHWWWRPGVSAAQQLLVWHVLLDDQPHVRDLAAEYQRRLIGIPCLDLVPAEWLHMTVHIAARVGEASPARIADMVSTVSRRLKELPPVEVSAGKPLVHREGIVLAIHPGDALAPIHQGVTAGVEAALGGGHISNEPTFAPHISIAYANGPAPTGPAISALKPASEPCPFTVTTVRLVAQQRHGHTYQWEPIASAPLGG